MSQKITPDRRGFREVRNTAGKLLFRYDPINKLVEIKVKGGDIEVVDLLMIDVESRKSSMIHNVFSGST